MGRLAAACVMALAGIAGALVLHDHHFASTFHMTANGVPKSYRAATLPSWRDPLALVCAFAAIAAAVLIARQPKRFALALGVVGCAFAGAVYLHQQAVHTIVCPPLVYGCVFAPRQGLWHHAASLLVMAAGIAVGLVVLLPRRRFVLPKLHVRHG